MIITDRGVEKSRFNALRAMVFNDENLVEAEDIHVEFFRSNGELYSTLRADRGTLNTETKDMDARNHVVVISHDNIRLETESLHWNESANLITTEDPVTLVQGGKKIRGIGMTSDPGLNDVKIRRPTGVFRDIEAPDEE
jgi:LPS export ABC transporter protein LptC